MLQRLHQLLVADVPKLFGKVWDLVSASREGKGSTSTSMIALALGEMGCFKDVLGFALALQRISQAPLQLRNALDCICDPLLVFTRQSEVGRNCNLQYF